MSWMDHLNYLQAVADEDVRHVMEKEATYQGSWKRSGGRSAWFMLRRKIDRMLEMLKKPSEPHDFSLLDLDSCIEAAIDLEDEVILAPEIVRHLRDTYTSEDIFLKIEEDPSGRDGTVLAEVRDLRRYLTLVEAEMMSRGVVSPPKIPWSETDLSKQIDYGDPRSSGPISSMDFAEAEKRVMAEVAEGKSDMQMPGTWPEACGPGTPEDGGHHAKHSNEYIEELILATHPRGTVEENPRES